MGSASHPKEFTQNDSRTWIQACVRGRAENARDANREMAVPTENSVRVLTIDVMAMHD